jgi:hypothetical protein
LRSQPTSKYPYETIDDDGITKVVVMTVEQADAINKKFRTLEGTITQQKIIIEKQIDTITRYEQKVVFVEVTNTQALSAQKAISDSLQLALDTITTTYSDLNKLLYEMAVGPTLLYTIPPYDEIMFLDLKYYNLYNDADGQLVFTRMSKSEYEAFKQWRETNGNESLSTIDYQKRFRFSKFEDKLTKRKIWKHPSVYK